MKKPKRLIFLTVLTVLAAALLCVCAGAESSGNYTYKIYDGKSSITGCDTSVSGVITIPDMIGACWVTAIADGAFEGCRSLTGVTIPDGVISIGEQAFYGCTALTEVAMGNEVESIGDYAFADCISLACVTIGNNVTSIGKNAFSGCVSLTGVTIPDSVISIGEQAYYGCTALTEVAMGNGVKSIGDYAFYGCTSLTSARVGDGVTTIGEETFYSVASGRALCPGSVTNIGDYAFADCISLACVTIGNNVTSIGKNALSGCVSLTGVTIPDSVTSIDDSAFDGCTSLTYVSIIGSGVTYIGNDAFYGTDYYNNSSNWENDVLYIGKYLIEAKDTLSGRYTVKDGTRYIAGYAFYNCTSLTAVTIPDSVTSIGERAFYGCDALTDINYGGTKSQWNELYIADDKGALTTAKIHYAKGEFPVILIVIGAAGVSLLGYCVNKAKKSKAKEGTAD